MECKDVWKTYVCCNTYIGIYPEWNVKDNPDGADVAVCEIGIYPEWNVKDGLYKRISRKRLILEYIQNGM